MTTCNRQQHLTAAPIAAIWGFLEATIFFLVPDIFLTQLVLRSGLKRGLIGCLWALAGALIGGVAIYALSQAGHSQTIARSFEFIPGISAPLITHAGDSLRSDGLLALFSAALHGTPYKLYALEAGRQNSPLLAFIVISALSRFARFSLTCLIASFFQKTVFRKFAPHHLLQIHLTFWGIFYALYFWIMSG